MSRHTENEVQDDTRMPHQFHQAFAAGTVPCIKPVLDGLLIGTSKPCHDLHLARGVTEDHERQEQVFESLHHNREPWIIRRDLTAANVPGHDRRAFFVGEAAYDEAGGAIIRDLFVDERGGHFKDAGLLDMLAIEKLREVAAEVQAEGWKWAEAHIDYPHAHGMRRFYPEPVALSDEDEKRLEAASTEYDQLDASKNHWRVAA